MKKLYLLALEQIILISLPLKINQEIKISLNKNDKSRTC